MQIEKSKNSSTRTAVDQGYLCENVVRQIIGNN